MRCQLCPVPVRAVLHARVCVHSPCAADVHFACQRAVPECFERVLFSRRLGLSFRDICSYLVEEGIYISFKLTSRSRVLSEFHYFNFNLREFLLPVM